MKIITNLLKIKSIWSLACITVFVILSLNGVMPIEVTCSIISSVVTYYFTKKKDEDVQ